MKKEQSTERWTRIEKQFRIDFPHLSGFSLGSDDFSELRCKARDDGTVLALVKGFGPDGGKVIAFGVGYDVILALMALDSTVQGGHWRIDKPWEDPNK